jgi:MFS family permease
MPLILVTGSPLLTLAVIGALIGPAGGIIMALPASVLSAESRHTGMGLFYTVYYVAMTVLPGVAGWLRDRTGVGIAPLLFGSAIAAAAIGCALLFRALKERAPALRVANLTKR